MKKYLFIIAALLIGSSAFAQYTPEDSYDEVYLQYGAKGLKGLKGTENVHNFNAISVGYNRGQRIVDEIPLFFSAGVQFQYITKCEKNDFYATREHNAYNIFGTGIPLNLVYNVPISNVISFEANAGVNAMYYWTSSVRVDGMEEIDLFCRTDSRTYGFPQAHRFNAAWQAGFRFQFAHVFVGVQYNQDFTKFQKSDDVNNRWRSVDFTLGWRF